jgi:hypothetical protein
MSPARTMRGGPQENGTNRLLNSMPVEQDAGMEGSPEASSDLVCTWSGSPRGLAVVWNFVTGLRLCKPVRLESPGCAMT